MSSIDDLAAQARAALAGDLPAAPEADPDRRHAGGSPDGLVRAEVSDDGRVQALEIDPDAMKQPLVDLLAAAADAINAARDARPGRLDLSGAAQVVAELQAIAREGLAGFAGAVDDVEARVRSVRLTRPTT